MIINPGRQYCISLLAAVTLTLTGAANADIIHESAQNAGSFSTVFLQHSEGGVKGSRFSLSVDTRITAYGGLTRSNGTVYTAIVPVVGAGALPAGDIEDIALVHNVFDAGPSPLDYRASTSIVLPPGEYAVVIGAGAFGASGANAGVIFDNPQLPAASYLSGNMFGWANGSSLAGMRFVVEGFTTGDEDGDGVSETLDNCLTVSNPLQTDSDGDSFGNACDADLNNDCIVNAVDLGILKSRFFSADADADFNDDGLVNVIDLGTLKSLFFQPPGPGAGLSACDFSIANSSTYTVNGTWSFDLDQGAQAPPGTNPPADMFFERNTAVESYFKPLNGSVAAVHGSDEPSAMDCYAAQMSTESIALDSIDVGVWMCALTDEGRFAKFQISSTLSLPVNTASQVTIDSVSWECETCAN